MNHNELFRLYCAEGLAVHHRRWRKRALGTCRPVLVPDPANRRWSLDFVSDAFEDRQCFRVLCIVINCTREALAIVGDRSVSGARMTRELDESIRRRNQPNMIVSDNKTAMTSHAVLGWCQEAGVGLHYIAPAKTDAESLCGVIYWPAPRRMPKRTHLRQSRRSPKDDRKLEDRLRHTKTAHIAWRAGTSRLR